MTEGERYARAVAFVLAHEGGGLGSLARHARKSDVRLLAVASSDIPGLKTRSAINARPSENPVAGASGGIAILFPPLPVTTAKALGEMREITLGDRASKTMPCAGRTFRSMKVRMLRTTHKPKIAQAIVGLVPVDVMDLLIGRERSAQGALHDDAMLAQDTAVYSYHDVAVLNGTTALPVWRLRSHRMSTHHRSALCPLECRNGGAASTRTVDRLRAAEIAQTMAPIARLKLRRTADTLTRSKARNHD